MPENEKPEEKKEEQAQPARPPESDGAMTAEDLAAVKAQLEEEKKAIAEAQALIQDKDSEIQKLQASISAANAELAQLKDAHSKAVAKYLDAVKVANPTIPADVITGNTIDEIDTSLAKAKSIAESVKKAIEAQAKEARVPAGAPARTGIIPEGLSPREKIIAGLAQKGG